VGVIEALIVHLRYQAAIWVEVDSAAEDVLHVVVDHTSMAWPAEALVSGGMPAARAAREAAQRIAGGSEWPSWDYGESPV